MSSWNKPSGAAKPEPKKPSAKGMLGVWCLVLGAALGVGAYFLFSGGGGAPDAKPVKERARIKEGARPGKDKPICQPAAAPKSEAQRKETTRDDGSGASARGDESGTTTTPGQAEPDKPKSKRVFDNSTDQLIAMAMSTPPGQAMPPLPGMNMGDSKRFVESLKKPIEIYDDDSDRVKAIKQTVQATREEIAQLMADNPNMTFADILQEHRKMHNEDVDVRNQTARELQKIIDEGDIEGAKKFRTTMNFALQQMGIKEIDTPITEEEKAAAEAAEENDN